MKFVFKGCARCGGDLFREDGSPESDLVCLQCGRRQMSESAYGLVAKMGKEEREKVVAGVA